MSNHASLCHFKRAQWPQWLRFCAFLYRRQRRIFQSLCVWFVNGFRKTHRVWKTQPMGFTINGYTSGFITLTSAFQMSPKPILKLQVVSTAFDKDWWCRQTQQSKCRGFEKCDRWVSRLIGFTHQRVLKTETHQQTKRRGTEKSVSETDVRSTIIYRNGRGPRARAYKRYCCSTRTA